MRFSVDMPYPSIHVAKKDILLAKELLNLYAGEVSEDTAIHSYIFQSLEMHDHKEFQEILKGIAIVEMHHLKILGLLIKKLGLTPLFVGVIDEHTKWFSGSYVTYERDFKTMLLDNIRREERTIKCYERVINKTTDEQVRHILKRIILDERVHIEIFEKIYKQYQNV